MASTSMSVAGRSWPWSGESGCGKSVTSFSIMQLVGIPGKIVDGEVVFQRTRPAEAAGVGDPATARRPTLDDLPTADIMPEPRLPRRRPDRRSPPDPPWTGQEAGMGAGRRAIAHGRRCRTGEAGAFVPSRDVRRYGTTRDDRDGPGVRAGAADRRRADDSAGRHDPGTDPRPDARPAVQAGNVDHPDHARYGRGRRDGSTGLGDVCGPRRRAGRGEHAFRRSAAPLHPGGCSRRSRSWGSSKRLDTIPGAVPNLIDLPPGCKFAPRCLARIEHNLHICTEQEPNLIEYAPGHRVRCWLYEDYVSQSENVSESECSRSGMARSTKTTYSKQPGGSIMAEVRVTQTNGDDLVVVKNLVKYFPIGAGAAARDCTGQGHRWREFHDQAG